jgi:CRP-like cAMP-binding protein
MSIYTPIRTSTEPLRRRLFNRGDLIPPYQNFLWRIERGVVRTSTWSSQGQAIALGYWGPGDIVGHPLSRVKPYQIECSTSVEMILLPSGLWEQALELMFKHIQQMEGMLSIVQRHPAEVRLWQFLVWLADKFGRDVDTGRLLDLPLTHQEIAEAIHLTRVTVTRMLQQFESEGRLRRHQRRLILCGNAREISSNSIEGS